jgi:integrase
VRRALDQFLAHVGDKPAQSYTLEDARRWKDYCAGLPRAWQTRLHRWNAVAILFGFAQRQALIRDDPFGRLTFERPHGARAERRLEWSRKDLQRLFSSPVYTEGQRFAAGAGEAAWWLPVLGLWTGARLGELAQLRRDDVVQVDGIWCLRIAPGDGKRVKTNGSIRTIPLHSELLRLGFLDYTASVPGPQLWPDMRVDSHGKWSGHYSRWFGRYRVQIGLCDHLRDFHSLRHSFKSACREAGIDRDLHDRITGHSSDGSVGSRYGSVSIARLKSAIDLIDFDVTIPNWKKSLLVPTSGACLSLIDSGPAQPAAGPCRTSR